MSVNGIHDKLEFERKPTADGTEVADVEPWVDPNYIFECTICQYVAQGKQEAWKHSKIHMAPSACNLM